MNEDKIRQLSTYLKESDELYEFVMSKAKHGRSVSDIIRAALAEQMQQEIAAYHTLQFVKAEILATP